MANGKTDLQYMCFCQYLTLYVHITQLLFTKNSNSLTCYFQIRVAIVGYIPSDILSIPPSINFQYSFIFLENFNLYKYSTLLFSEKKRKNFNSLKVFSPMFQRLYYMTSDHTDPLRQSLPIRPFMHVQYSIIFRNHKLYYNTCSKSVWSLEM